MGGDVWKGDTHRDIFSHHLPDGSMPESYSQLNEKKKFKMAEIGLDWTKSYQIWKWHVVGLGLINDRQYEYQLDESDLLNELSQSGFKQDRLKTELIARTTLSMLDLEQIKPEFGIEIAHNRLDTAASETESGLTTSVEGADVIVEELRGEFFTTFSYELNTSLSLEGGLIAELSKITVSGDSEQEQSFPLTLHIFKNQKEFQKIEKLLSSYYL